MRTRLWTWLLLLSGVTGAALTFALVEGFSPDAGLRLPHESTVARRAALDAAALGLEVEGRPGIRPSAGPARVSSVWDLAVLQEGEPDARRRRERMQAAPPLRLGARFPGVASPGGRQGELLLEYGGTGQLVGASFGFDRDAPVWMRQGVRTVLSHHVADALLGPERPTYRAMPEGLAERLDRTLVGPDAPKAQVVESGATREEICQTTPGRYLYWRNDGRWLAHLQPVAYAAVGRATAAHGGTGGRARYYGGLLAALVALLLTWRAFRQTRKLGRMDVRALLLAAGLLPLLPCLDRDAGLVAALAPPLVLSVGVGLVWYLAETALRAARPAAVEHWDRFVGGRSVTATGHRLLAGFAAGSLLAAWLVGGPAALERSGSALGELRGGYGTLIAILPDYAWLPSSLSQGLALGAASAALVGVALKLAGPWGVVGGTLASALLWTTVSPAWPPLWALLSGLGAAAGASLVLMRLGFLAHLAACVTALSLPTLAVAVLALPQLGAAVVAAAAWPALLLAAGLALSVRAPESRPGESPLSELKTLLLCDLVDSTAMVRKLGDSRAAELFGEHDHVARELLQRFGGREIDKTDGFLLVFDRPIQAVRFAVEYNRALDRLSEKVGVEMASRVGIHFGEVYVRRNTPEDVARGAKPMEIEGLAKPVAARLMSLAQARQALLTRAAFDLARRAAVSEMTSTGRLRWRAHGKYHVKGMDEAVEVFEVSEEDLAPLAAPSNSEKAWREPSTRSAEGSSGPIKNALEVGEEIGHYRIEAIAGRGAMGEVYAARDRRLGRRVAVKALPDHLALRSDSTTRFHREARALAILEHPNIVTVYSIEEREGRPFMIMELVEGENLGAHMPSGGMSTDSFYSLALPLVAALSAAHAKGITHRDLKPSNVMVGEGGRLKVLDFGLAKTTTEPFGAGGSDSPGFGSSAERVLGTVPYMSPEQLRGGHVDRPSDVFSLGVLFFEMLSGHRPFSGESTADLVSAILRDAPPSLLDLKPDLPADLAGIVARCLEKAPEDRYQKAAGLLDALTTARAHEDIAQDSAGASTRGTDR